MIACAYDPVLLPRTDILDYLIDRLLGIAIAPSSMRDELFARLRAGIRYMPREIISAFPHFPGARTVYLSGVKRARRPAPAPEHELVRFSAGYPELVWPDRDYS